MRIQNKLLNPTPSGNRYELSSPTAMPSAGAFLWNQKMMIQMTCRGYATSQFMQPEPAKYSHAPNIEAKTFMQPEHNYYAHYPGRFVYIKDEETGNLFSAPYEPVREDVDRFVFSAGKGDIIWTVEHLGIRVEMRLALPTQDVVEMWTVKVTNLSNRPRKISVYPYFTIGYMSWMNQSAKYRTDLGGIVGSSITPYQKIDDYFKNKHLKDKTYFLCETQPTSYETIQQVFEGEGGLHGPSSIMDAPELEKGEACYETPAAVVQYRLNLREKNEQREYRFIFGPACDDAEIRSMREKYLSKGSFDQCAREYAWYMEQGRGCLHIETHDKDLDNFVNNWLPRQAYYHGDMNRLTTDPQTRNYLQDSMGMSFIKPTTARKVFLTALSQQEASGAMPDGILLVEGAELKYINQIPHTDHCVWLPLVLELYLTETADYALLDEVVPSENGDKFTVFERICRAMEWLLSCRDHRGLSYIQQGDWCDPMNMVGYKGRGVSGWLTLATGYALKTWALICAEHNDPELEAKYLAGVKEVNAATNKHLWDGEWFGRGITDDNVTFGIKKDVEGRIWLNPQTWSILSGAASPAQRVKMVKQVDQQLGTPYGVQMFAPAYTAMREDVGRVTQKAPGSAENASVYNHAAIFYIYALYEIGDSDRAYKLLRQMLPGPSEQDYLARGQMPIFLPNYYRGAWKQFPRTAGRSSQLFNTGTVSWAYRVIVEGLCGLKGEKEGLVINPQLPKEWNHIKVTRLFRGAKFIIDVKRGEVKETTSTYNGKIIKGNRFEEIQPGAVYEIKVYVPEAHGGDNAQARILNPKRRGTVN